MPEEGGPPLKPAYYKHDWLRAVVSEIENIDDVKRILFYVISRMESYERIMDKLTEYIEERKV